MASKYETKKIPQIKKELLEKHSNKPIEWWAQQLAMARRDLWVEAETSRKFRRMNHDEERSAAHLRVVNKNLMALLKKAGYQQSKIRVTENFYECTYNDELTQEQKDEGEECWGSHDDCEDCEACYKKTVVNTVCVYDYSVVDDVLRYIGADLVDDSTEYEELLKVEDVTNPKHPIVIWEENDGT